MKSEPYENRCKGFYINVIRKKMILQKSNFGQQ